MDALLGPLLVVLDDELEVALGVAGAALGGLTFLVLVLDGLVLHCGIIIYNSESSVKFHTRRGSC